MSETGLWNTIKSSLKSQTATWIVGIIIGLLTLFSSQITERVKFALNRADQRMHQLEEISKDVSEYVFAADLLTEFIENDWTTEKSLSERITSYNNILIPLRKKEYVYIAWT